MPDTETLLAQRARMRAAEAIQDAAKAIREGRDDLARELLAEGTGRLDALRGNGNGD